MKHVQDCLDVSETSEACRSVVWRLCRFRIEPYQTILSGDEEYVLPIKINRTVESQ